MSLSYDGSIAASSGTGAVDAAPLLTVQDLRVTFEGSNSPAAVDGVSFDVRSGETLAIVGESGSGKSVTAMSILRLLPEHARVSGRVLVQGENVLDMSPARLRGLRAHQVSVIFQDPMGSLNPFYKVGFQLVESIRLTDPALSRSQARARAVELLRLVHLPDPEQRLGYYPHQLSGGQCQRVMIAMALASEPRLLIADEPTTALDVTVQAEILDLLRDLRGRVSTAIMLITHDMGVVADLADRVLVMRQGRVVEDAEVHELYAHPKESYTRSLLDAVPRLHIEAHDRAEPTVVSAATPALALDGLVVEFRRPGNPGRFRAVDDVTLEIRPGEVMGLVGESGSGKSTIGRSILGLAPISSGDVRIDGVSVAGVRRGVAKEMRKKIGVVFQNPADSLDPRYSVGKSVGEPLSVHRGIRGSELTDRVDSLLSQVGMPGDWRDRLPHELSGGQRQRVAIARAISLEPALLIADEPTSALDVSVQARVLETLAEMQQSLGFACLFISHDLAVVDRLCSSIAVLTKGELVEMGGRDEILSSPQTEYTRRLLAASPVPDPVIQRNKPKIGMEALG